VKRGKSFRLKGIVYGTESVFPSVEIRSNEEEKEHKPLLVHQKQQDSISSFPPITSSVDEPRKDSMASLVALQRSPSNVVVDAADEENVESLRPAVDVSDESKVINKTDVSRLSAFASIVFAHHVICLDQISRFYCNPLNKQTPTQ